MSWSVNVNDTFARANTSVGSPGSTTDVGNGWIDHNGIYNISSNTLIGTSQSTTGSLTDYLIRQSSENAVDQRIKISFEAQFIASGVALRVQTSGDHYNVFLTSSGIYLFVVVGGVSTQVGSTLAVTGYRQRDPTFGTGGLVMLK